MKELLMYHIDLTFGDWSNDGHGQCKTYRIHTNFNPDELRLLMGRVDKLLDFNFTGQTDGLYASGVCGEYGQASYSSEEIKKLKEAGFNVLDLIQQYCSDTEEEIDGSILNYVDAENIFILLLDLLKWAAKKDGDDLFIEKDEAFVINTRMGYGCFYA